jgi:cob(I)alamin adenosyltransferase
MKFTNKQFEVYIMKIYTKTGDAGQTSLLSGERVDKDSLRVETYGTIDEITSTLGMAKVWSKHPEVCETILNIQKTLMLAMADLASIDGQTAYITPEHISLFENSMDHFDKTLPPLTEFLIPGGNAGAAALDLARTVARRAERQALRLAKQEQVNAHLLILLNRLSDLCFILMRTELELFSRSSHTI